MLRQGQMYAIFKWYKLFTFRVLITFNPSRKHKSLSGTEISEDSFYRGPKLGIHQHFPASKLATIISLM